MRSLSIIRILFITGLIVLAFSSCTKYNTGHSCPFKLCPYKGLTRFEGVIETGGTKVDQSLNGSDVYKIDSLHFIYPLYSYDELESILF